MAAHLLETTDVYTNPRVRLSGYNYRGAHRRVALHAIGEPGTLVLEPGSLVPSSVIARIDASSALVRHIGTCDDHPAQLDDLRPFADGVRVRVGSDHGDSH